MKRIFTITVIACLCSYMAIGQKINRIPVNISASDLVKIESTGNTASPVPAKSIREAGILRHAQSRQNVEREFPAYRQENLTLRRMDAGALPGQTSGNRGGSLCALDEGFEVSVPPSGWTLNQVNVTETWGQDDYEPTVGTYYASCFYDPNLVAQLEQLITPQVDLTALNDPSFSFSWLMSYAWSVDPNDNYDLNVYIRGNGGSWQLLWTETDAGVFTDWEWYNENISLTPYASFTNAEFMFEYDGLDGAQASVEAVSVCGVASGAPCTASANTYGDLNTAGGAPCFDGISCGTTDPAFSGLGIYGSEGYLLNNVQAGFDYVFDMCTGFGAGAWIPEITIVAPDGTTVDASNDEPATGSSATHGSQCSIEWTASQSGTYTIFINQLGTAAGDAPNQVSCTTTYAVDNGNPTVTCGTNPPLCLTCEIAGTLTSSLSQTVCPSETGIITLDGTQSSPGDYSIGFNDALGGTGGLAGGFTVTGFGTGDFPYSFDNDLNGVLSFNELDPLLGQWVLTVYATDPNGDNCDSTVTFVVDFLAANDPLCSGGGSPCIESADTWTNLNVAPCFDGNTCVPSDAGFTTFGLYGSEGYTLTNVQAGFDYVFDMCSGFGAGAWIPEITIVAPDGTTVDASNNEPATGSSATHASQCSLAWTATQSGTYTIFINELGTAAGDAPNQVSCTTTYAVDNGNPTVTCGANPPLCLTCEIAGTLTSSLSQTVCPSETGIVTLDGTQSSPGDFSIGFSDVLGGTGGLAGGFTLTGLASGDFPYSFDNDLNGVLSFNDLDPLLGQWVLTVYATDPNGENCDSTVTFVVDFLAASDPICLTVGIGDLDGSVDVKVYPNPSNGSFFIEVNGEESQGQLILTDLRGRVVYAEKVLFTDNFRKSMDLNLGKSFYLLQVRTPRSNTVLKVEVLN